MKNDKTVTWKTEDFSEEAEDPTKWDYLGLGKNWGWNCYQGMKQSPIDIWARGSSNYDQHLKLNFRANDDVNMTIN